jgi:hypothetical protein
MKKKKKKLCNNNISSRVCSFSSEHFYETDMNNNVVSSHALHKLRSIAELIPQSLQLQVQVALTSLG